MDIESTPRKSVTVWGAVGAPAVSYGGSFFARQESPDSCNPSKAELMLQRMSLRSPPKADPVRLKRPKHNHAAATLQDLMPPPSSPTHRMEETPHKRPVPNFNFNPPAPMTPWNQRKPAPVSAGVPLDAPSPMPTWGASSLRDASAGGEEQYELARGSLANTTPAPQKARPRPDQLNAPQRHVPAFMSNVAPTPRAGPCPNSLLPDTPIRRRPVTGDRDMSNVFGSSPTSTEYDSDQELPQSPLVSRGGQGGMFGAMRAGITRSPVSPCSATSEEEDAMSPLIRRPLGRTAAVSSGLRGLGERFGEPQEPAQLEAMYGKAAMAPPRDMGPPPSVVRPSKPSALRHPVPMPGMGTPGEDQLSTTEADASFLKRPGPVTVDKMRRMMEDNASPTDVTLFQPVTPWRDPGSAVGPGRSLMSGTPCDRRMSGGHAPAPYMSIFERDFQQVGVLGSGSFGTVYKAVSRLDKCTYAVKCIRRRFKGEADRQNMLKEVEALAAISAHAQDTLHTVRYYHAWQEDERLYIQTELCETSLEKMLLEGKSLGEQHIYDFLRQTLLGLEQLHQNNLVHLDIKPGNIFIKEGLYKLGDFGLVAPANTGSDIMEGDSRYMSRELLQDDHSHLKKCDIFSLGATLYEIISGRPPPPNGEEWHQIRSGQLRLPPMMPQEMKDVLTRMMHPDPVQRPSASELLQYPSLQSDMEKMKSCMEKKMQRDAQLIQSLQQDVKTFVHEKSSKWRALSSFSRSATWDSSYIRKLDDDIKAPLHGQQGKLHRASLCPSAPGAELSEMDP